MRSEHMQTPFISRGEFYHSQAHPISIYTFRFYKSSNTIDTFLRALVFTIKDKSFWYLYQSLQTLELLLYAFQ